MKIVPLMLMAFCLAAVVLIVAGCGGTKNSSPVHHTPPTLFSSSTADGALPATAIAITSHSAEGLASYCGACLMCHGANATNQYPLPPSWDGAKNGSTVHRGTYPVTAGSPADHTGRLANACTQSGCHAAPTA